EHPGCTRLAWILQAVAVLIEGDAIPDSGRTGEPLDGHVVRELGGEAVRSHPSRGGSHIAAVNRVQDGGEGREPTGVRGDGEVPKEALPLPLGDLVAEELQDILGVRGVAEGAGYGDCRAGDDGGRNRRRPSQGAVIDPVAVVVDGVRIPNLVVSPRVGDCLVRTLAPAISVFLIRLSDESASNRIPCRVLPSTGAPIPRSGPRPMLLLMMTVNLDV